MKSAFAAENKTHLKANFIFKTKLHFEHFSDVSIFPQKGDSDVNVVTIWRTLYWHFRAVIQGPRACLCVCLCMHFICESVDWSQSGWNVKVVRSLCSLARSRCVATSLQRGCSCLLAYLCTELADDGCADAAALRSF